jgi:hypothetical protein
MPFADTLPQPLHTSQDAGHGQPDWSDEALYRTWRTASRVGFGLSVIHAFIHPAPATAFALLGLWARARSLAALRYNLRPSA